ncbi:MAG: type IV-A pilus assembly ATPase PilB [Methylococcaceae bacterium]|jgi:type IV pilus assembly protein PilB|nr:type IV-A pilus assembly ATPase PilB [Methylococcaceae bacterium]MDZ4156770.1 type IV-A pilus assembly ATPase PilB [Methylococcales bacterium]MDP2393326.1 type IV-A pilus assembly ATPase PilB [Methylococcaceae bacterium]MDP3018353.1 type IV-A pilus assembly ATPase PilB [Methylococcaceae bacterium]MDP3388570.1 type IV-A pilus assembly ATPase PilB [Methylococcaceae bacterium]
MASVFTDLQFNGLTRCFIENGLLTENDAQKYIQDAQKAKVSLIAYLVTNKLIDSKTIAARASVEFGIPYFDLDAIDYRSLPISRVAEKLIRKHHALPLFIRGNTLFLAISDPTNFQALDDIKFQSRLNPEAILVEEDKLAKIIDIALEAADTSMSDMLDADLDNLEITGGDEDTTKTDSNSDIDDAPIVRFVNKILLDAIKQGVSDIHMEPYEKNFRIRYRADGILHQIASPPASISGRIISRIKVMSKMDIAERRVPQDGRIKMTLSKNRAIDFRVNTCPTLFGEKVVLRILDPTSAQIGIEKLGFEPEQQRLFLNAINKPYGLVLVTGPTGSGKTVTLYTGLNLLNSVERNISTAEDPVEITVEGINQVNMNVKSGLTFATALRAFLRQDPDIIMVGEIRDTETAEIAVKAAQTGHLVLSTLHTNDAPQTLNRLMQMGIPPFNIVSAVNLIMAQRLARRLCERCKTPADYPEVTYLSSGFKQDELATLKIFKAGSGCEHCTNGYKGRVGIYQVMTLSEKMRSLILEGGNAMQLAEQATADGINDLRASGLNKVRMGVTSLEEIDRVTKE